MASSKVVYSVTFEKTISRLFLFRPLWLAVEIWVLLAWSIWIAIVSFFQFFYMLIFGRRHREMFEMQLHFARHSAKWNAYLQKLSNGRPKFIED